MKIIPAPNHRLDEFRRYVHTELPQTQASEIMANALVEDTNVHHLVAVHEHLIGAAVSYNLSEHRLHIFNIGSMRRGWGSMLTTYLEELARVRGVPVTCLSLPSARGFWLQRGYRMVCKPKSNRSMTPMKLPLA